MPFKKNSPEARAAGSKGGRRGTKYFSTMSEAELKKFTAAAGRKSGVAKRARKLQKAQESLDKSTDRYENRVISNYLK